MVLAVVAVVTLGGGLLVGVSAGASAQGGTQLTGTFRITAGICNPVTKSVNGSYFRLIFPRGNRLTGPFFQNSTSPCYDKSYTTVSPGTRGGW